jgi:hypothetical protein
VSTGLYGERSRVLPFPVVRRSEIDYGVKAPLMFVTVPDSRRAAGLQLVQKATARSETRGPRKWACA